MLTLVTLPDDNGDLGRMLSAALDDSPDGSYAAAGEIFLRRIKRAEVAAEWLEAVSTSNQNETVRVWTYRLLGIIQ